MEGASQKSENNLAVAEVEIDKQTNANQELSKKLDGLQTKAEEAARLKDQLDEYDDLPSFSRTFFLTNS